MDTLKNICDELDVKSLQTLALAYVGDAYFNLFVRVKLLKYKHKVGDLNDISAKMVSAVYQSKAYHLIEDMLVDDEKYIFKRGRNAKSRTTHSASTIEYHESTGFETLLGVLFIENKIARLNEISDAAFNAVIKEILQ